MLFYRDQYIIIIIMHGRLVDVTYFYVLLLCFTYL